MKIIQHGALFLFNCPVCGCIFRCSRDEVDKIETDNCGDDVATDNCPDCLAVCKGRVCGAQTPKKPLLGRLRDGDE